MSSVEVSHITKSFGLVKAVDDLSFEVNRGEIFGLLGPNGAGKTTAIRVILDIFKPDIGRVSVLGGPMDEAKKNRIGYMPEERGLYQDVPLERCLVYLGSLKGLSPDQARQQIDDYLERFDLAAHKKNKVKELSKGMQQKAQIIATLLHRPELVIIDEPFTGLDPVNTRMVKDLLKALRAEDVTIMMSTHHMHQVEELCDRILLIHHGRAMLYGDLESIRRRYSGHAVLVRAAGNQHSADLLEAVPGVERTEVHNASTKLFLAAGTSPQDVLHSLLAQDVILERFEIATPTLDEIFIRVVRDEGMPGA
ncbi:MAG: ATP-binding cassette domain-containing protein [Anaerolineales bacterium]